MQSHKNLINTENSKWYLLQFMQSGSGHVVAGQHLLVWRTRDKSEVQETVTKHRPGDFYGEQLKLKKKKNESILNKVLEYQIKSMNEKQQLNLLVPVLGQQQTEK